MCAMRCRVIIAVVTVVERFADALISWYVSTIQDFDSLINFTSLLLLLKSSEKYIHK